VRLPEALRDCDLPDELRAHVAQVVGRTRLWRREREDVALELIAHFRDGLEAGAEPDAMLRDFGDPHQAARLIRRATRRKRPVWWQAWSLTVRGAGAGLALLIAVYLILFVRFHTASPSPSRDYLEAINARAATVAPEDRAWPLYERAFERLGYPDGLARPEWAGRISIEEVGPGNPLHAEAMAYLREAQPWLDLVREGAGKPGMGLVLRHPEPTTAKVSMDTTLFGVLAPHLTHARVSATLLAYEARHGLLEGDADLVHANILAVFGLARHIREHPFLISDMVAFAIVHLGCDLVMHALTDHPELLSRDRLVEIAHALGSWGDGYPALQLDGDRWGFTDIMQHIYTSDRSGDGRLTPAGVRLLDEIAEFSCEPSRTNGWRTGISAAVGPVASTVIAGRAEMMRVHNELMRKTEQFVTRPMWTWDELPSPEHRVRAWSDLQAMRYAPITTLLPAMGRAVQSAHLTRTRLDVTAIAIALELYRREHGALPERLDQLVPRWLPTVPLDPFDGQPLRYAVRDGVAHVWSIGADRKDDDGRPPGFESSWFPVNVWVPIDDVHERLNDPARARGFDGDWVLLPPRRWAFIAEDDPRLMEVLGIVPSDDDSWLDEGWDDH